MNQLSELFKKNFEKIVSNVNSAALACGRNPEDITIVSVSKTHPAEIILAAKDAGIYVFGENYVQELQKKYEDIPPNERKGLIWHYIGHLQTNKVKLIIPFIDVIQTVDSLHIALEISRQAEKVGRNIDILIQVNTSGEENKSGCEPEELLNFAHEVHNLPNLNLLGLMTIGSFTEDKKISRREFRLLKYLLNNLNSSEEGLNLRHLSMGMSHDYKIAIEEGATILRIGTAIFGERVYG